MALSCWRWNFRPSLGEINPRVNLTILTMYKNWIGTKIGPCCLSHPFVRPIQTCMGINRRGSSFPIPRSVNWHVRNGPEPDTETPPPLPPLKPPPTLDPHPARHLPVPANHTTPHGPPTLPPACPNCWVRKMLDFWETRVPWIHWNNQPPFNLSFNPATEDQSKIGSIVKPFIWPITITPIHIFPWSLSMVLWIRSGEGIMHPSFSQNWPPP
mmetsp:Transcript_9494/g.17234  ORF Transcript_9494/g.17234 Transcript_9494/m.17234 type:complete len:212 (-) Transcript_9494:280-915(-)